MARVLGLDGDYIPPELRTALVDHLRLFDEGIILPGAQRSPESGGVKNVVMRLNGTEHDLRADVFTPNWFMGVSAVQVGTQEAEALLSDPARRCAALRALAEAIPSEMASSEVQVGPELDGEATDADSNPWQFGFDSPSCCVGLYAAEETRAPRAGVQGMDRVHKTYYLVCKAGGGVAAQTFHARLTAALSKGASLDEALEQGTEPGPQALRRVGVAAKRNRGRILVAAAKTLGFHGIDTISDQASPPGQQYRVAITALDVACNVLRKVDLPERDRSVWQYTSGCVDAASSLGLVTASNAARGFVLFTGADGEFKVTLRNSVHDAIPFCTPRLSSNREAVTKAAEAHKRHLAKTASDGGGGGGGGAMGEGAHPDGQWLRERFAWVNSAAGGKAGALPGQIEPPPLWGTFEPEAWVQSWARELGLAQLRQVRLGPEIVAIAGVEPGKLRAAVRHVQSGAGASGGMGMASAR
jgi:hypothetical protein